MSANTRPVVGITSKVYVGAAGLSAGELAHSAHEVKLATAADIALARTAVDVAIRGDAWKRQITQMKDATLTLKLVYTPNGDAFQRLQAAFFGDKLVGVFVTDGRGNGLVMDAGVTGITVPQTLDGATVVTATLAVSLSRRDPQWVG